MSLPLSGIRVVEMCQILAGPFTAMLLADQGADVIKVEPPEGDSARRLVPNYPESKGLSLGYLTFNRNKRSIVVNMSKPKGRDLVYDLLREADVLLMAMRTGTRQRRGLTYEEVAAINPRLIYLSLTGFGEKGPEADQPGIDIVTQARVGDMAGRLTPGGPPPEHTHLYHFDMATSMLAAFSVTLALNQRERTGRGQKIEVSLLQSALASQAIQMTQRVGSDDSYAIRAVGIRGTHLCSDGRYLYAGAGGVRWESFCRSVGLDHLAEDPRFNTPEKRLEQADELTEILSRHFATRPAAEWEAMLKADNHITSVVREVSEVYDDPQVVANEMITEFEQPGFGTVKAVTVPFKMSESTNEPWLRRHAPTLGENTQEVLRELGRSQEEIEALAEEEVIA